MIAYKWLAELHGVLCTDSRKKNEIIIHQNGLEIALTHALTIQQEVRITDSHLSFLLLKKKCKVIIYTKFLVRYNNYNFRNIKKGLYIIIHIYYTNFK